MSLKKISQGCKDYFNVPKDIKGFGKKSTKVKVQTALKWVSYITLLIPAAFGATYAIASLLGRVRKETPKEKSAPVSRVASEVFEGKSKKVASGHEEERDDASESQKSSSLMDGPMDDQEEGVAPETEGEIIPKVAAPLEGPLPTAEKEIEKNAMRLSREQLLGLEMEKLREIDFSQLTPEKANELFLNQSPFSREGKIQFEKSKEVFKKLTLDQMLCIAPLATFNKILLFAIVIEQEMLRELDLNRLAPLLVPEALSKLNLPMLLMEWEMDKARKSGEGGVDEEQRLINFANQSKVAEELIRTIFSSGWSLRTLNAEQFNTIHSFVPSLIQDVPPNLIPDVKDVSGLYTKQVQTSDSVNFAYQLMRIESRVDCLTKNQIEIGLPDMDVNWMLRIKDEYLKELTFENVKNDDIDLVFSKIFYYSDEMDSSLKMAPYEEIIQKEPAKFALGLPSAEQYKTIQARNNALIADETRNKNRFALLKQEVADRYILCSKKPRFELLSEAHLENLPEDLKALDSYKAFMQAKA